MLDLSKDSPGNEREAEVRELKAESLRERAIAVGMPIVLRQDEYYDELMWPDGIPSLRRAA